jgi:hypothetical protein
MVPFFVLAPQSDTGSIEVGVFRFEVTLLFSIPIVIPAPGFLVPF